MNNRILIFGDSIVWGAWDKEGGWVGRLKRYAYNQAEQSDFEKYNTVYGLGVSGDSTCELLLRIKTELISRLDDESGLVTMIAIGTNDSQFDVATNENEVPESKFTSNLGKLIGIAKEYSQRTVLIGLLPVDDKLLHPMPWKPTHGYSNAHIKRYDKTLKRIAKKKNVPFIDLHYYFQEQDYKLLLSDGLHPNTNGHELIYSKVLNELKTLEILE